MVLEWTYCRFDENVVDSDARDLSINRIRQQLHLPVLGKIDETDLERYYPRDTTRSVDAYLAFAGISTTDVAKDHWPCDQLHWVPYTNPERLQALVPGYEMARTSTVHTQRDTEAFQSLVVGAVAVALVVVTGYELRRRRQTRAYARVAVEREDNVTSWNRFEKE